MHRGALQTLGERGRVGMDIEMHDQDARTVSTAIMMVFLCRRGHGGTAGA